MKGSIHEEELSSIFMLRPIKTKTLATLWWTKVKYRWIMLSKRCCWKICCKWLPGERWPPLRTNCKVQGRTTCWGNSWSQDSKETSWLKWKWTLLCSYELFLKATERLPSTTKCATTLEDAEQRNRMDPFRTRHVRIMEGADGVV